MVPIHRILSEVRKFPWSQKITIWHTISPDLVKKFYWWTQMTHFTIPERCEHILFCLSADNKSNEPKQNQLHTFRKNQSSYVMGNSKDKNKGRRTSLNTSKSKKSLGKWLTGTFQTFLAEIFELLFLGSRKCPSTQISSKGIIFDNKHDELKILQIFEDGSFQTFFRKSVFLRKYTNYRV